MSKRPSTDLDITKNSKRSKRTLQTTDLNESHENETFSQQSMDLEHFIEFNQTEFNELKLKSTKILEELPKEQKLIELTNLFREIITSGQEQQKLSSLFTIVLDYLSTNSTKLDDKLVSQISLLLSLQIDSLPIVVLKNSVDLFLSQINLQKPFNEKCIELFVELFRYIQKLPMTDLEKNQSIGSEKFTGNDYIHRKITEIFSVKWTESTSLNILCLIKTMQLDQNEIKLLLNKLFNINEVNWSNIQIPTLINQVLTFCNQKQNRPLVFEKILSFSNELRKNSINQQKSDFIDAETLSILHIIHLLKTDNSIAKDLIKILKSKLNKNLIELVQPFTFGLLLSLVKVLSQQEGVVDLLRQITTRVYESEIKYKQYFWVSRCFSEDEKKLSTYLIKPSKCRLYLSEHILSGLIEFLFDLFDNNGVRMTKNNKPVGLNEKITQYASEMLRDLFRNSTMSRDDILNQLTERIFSSSVNKSIVFIDQLTILISSEPASSFQDYFRKFKSRLDHMIYMTPIVALEFLTSIKPLLKYDSIYKDNLIITLKKSIFQSDLDVRKVGLNGLICLLNQTKLSNFLPSSQASQSMSFSQSQSQVSRMTMSQEKNSEKNCLDIFQSLRRCLTQQVEIRSKLYQSSCNLIVQNTTLVGPTLNLLLLQFENYIIKTNLEIILDFSKCLKVNDLNEIELVEPLDILMHCLHLCNESYVKMGLQSKFAEQLDEDIKNHSDVIKRYFEDLKQNFLSQSPQYLIETYKTQCASMILAQSKAPKSSLNQTATQQTTRTQKQTQLITNNNSTDLSTSMAFYQCLLGCVESLIEHFFISGSIKASRDLFKKFNTLYDLIHKQFIGGSDETNSRKKSSNQTPSKSQKKKTNNKKKDNLKKENKENIDENENDETTNQDDDIKASAYDQSKVADLSSLEQNPLLESTTTIHNTTAKLAKKSSNKSSNNKKTNMPKFNYVHRISYTCLLKILQVYFTNENNLVKLENNDDFLDESLDNYLINVKVDNSFHNYLIKILNQHLDFILNETTHLKTNAKSNSLIYDAESYDEKSLFKYLNQIWIIFWKQLSHLKCPTSECTAENFYCEECIKSKSVYIKILSNIWKIVSLKFNPKLSDLFSFSIFEENSNDSISPSNSSTIAVGVLDQCRRFIDKCVSSQVQYVQNSYKLAGQLIDFMYDIASNISLKIDDLGILFKWSQQLTNERDIRDQPFIKSLFKFFIFVTWNKNSSATLMKYICLDLIHVYGILSIFRNYIDESTDKYFTCLTDETSLPMINIICDELANQLNLIEWFISFKTDSNSISSFYKQLNCILECLKILLIIDLPVNVPHEVIIRILSKFYSFMILFCKSVTTREISSDEEKALKNIADYTAKYIQNPLSNFIRTIQNAKSGDIKEKDGKDDKSAKQKGKDSNNDKFNSAKINFTENFEIRLRDFKIVLTSKNNQSDDEASYSPSEDRDDETNDGTVDRSDNESERPSRRNRNSSEPDESEDDDDL